VEHGVGGSDGVQRTADGVPVIERGGAARGQGALDESLRNGCILGAGDKHVAQIKELRKCLLQCQHTLNNIDWDDRNNPIYSMIEQALKSTEENE
jgi:hypothetical protein